MVSLEILPGRGLGPLRFGMASTEVKEILGQAPSTSFEDDGDFSSDLWEYPDKDLALFFRRSEGYRLSSIEIGASPGYTLFGEALFPRDKVMVISLLRANLRNEDISQIAEDIIESLGQTFFRIPQLGCVLYFNKEDMLEDAQWSPLLDSHDNFVWPKSAG